MLNITEINVDTITALNENGGDANVATGYHAVMTDILLEDITSPTMKN